MQLLMFSATVFDDFTHKVEPDPMGVARDLSATGARMLSSLNSQT